MKNLAHWLLFKTVTLAAVLLRLIKRPSTDPVRSLWAGAPILNMGVNAKAERLLGVKSDSLVYETYYVTDAFTYDLSRWMGWPIVRGVVPYIVLLWATARYRRFHFYRDRGLLKPRRPHEFVVRELELLKRLGAEIFIWTYGADVRTTDATRALGEPNCCTHCPARGRACICDDAAGARLHEQISRYATAVFSMGDMIEYAPGSITDVFFWPVDLTGDEDGRYEPRPPPDTADAPLLVVHASNHRAFKGTDYLVAAVRRLESEGVPIRLELVEGLPNAEALEIYRRADLIFDQCLIGFHGYFAQEAMTLAKPVMCFIRKPAEYLLHPEECPIINTPADRIEPTLRELVADRGRLRELGERGRSYIERYHTTERFAERLGRVYERLGIPPS